METATPNLEEAKKFADAVIEKFPGKLPAIIVLRHLIGKHLSDDEIGSFQKKLLKWVINFNL